MRITFTERNHKVKVFLIFIICLVFISCDPPNSAGHRKGFYLFGGDYSYFYTISYNEMDEKYYLLPSHNNGQETLPIMKIYWDDDFFYLLHENGKVTVFNSIKNKFDFFTSTEEFEKSSNKKSNFMDIYTASKMRHEELCMRPLEDIPIDFTNKYFLSAENYSINQKIGDNKINGIDIKLDQYDMYFRLGFKPHKCAKKEIFKYFPICTNE